MHPPSSSRRKRTQNSSTAVRALAVAVSAASLVGLAACAVGPDAGLTRAKGVSTRSVDVTEATALPNVVDAARRIGTTVLSSEEADKNVVVSPASLANALAILAEGANGVTQTDLSTTLGATGEDRRDAFAALRASIKEHDGDPSDATGKELPDETLIHLANRLVIQDNFEVKPEFLHSLADVFDTGLLRADLGLPSGMKALDTWVNYHTGGLVPQSAITPDPDLRLVIQDAVLFASKWNTPFEEDDTKDLPFTLLSGDSVDVPTMSIYDEPFSYADLTDGWSVLRLPYTSGATADVFLPPAGTDPTAITPELLAEAAQSLRTATPGAAAVWLPTIDLRDTLKLVDNDALDHMGAGSILCHNPGVDFTGVGSVDTNGEPLAPGDLCISQATQQVVLRVNEDGTVAAAVTELGMSVTSAPPEQPPLREFHFDRPFLFTINHTETDWPLFYAAIRDPRFANS